MKIRMVSVGGAVIVALSMSGAALAADGAALFKEKTCIACHGKDAKSPIMPNYPRLAGQNEQYVLQQLKDIKSGARNNGQTAAMKGVMGIVSEDDMKAIAKWISSLK